MFPAVMVADKSWKMRNPQVSQTYEQIKRSNKKHRWAGLWVRDLSDKYVFCTLTYTKLSFWTPRHMGWQDSTSALQVVPAGTTIVCTGFGPYQNCTSCVNDFLFDYIDASCTKAIFLSSLLGVEDSTTFCFKTIIWVWGMFSKDVR